MATGGLVNDSIAQANAPEWRELRAYRFHVLLIKEDDGDYSAIVLNLPGIGSCATSEEEAMRRVRDAIVGAMEVYLESDGSIPWRETSGNDIPFGAKQKWIIVHV